MYIYLDAVDEAKQPGQAFLPTASHSLSEVRYGLHQPCCCQSLVWLYSLTNYHSIAGLPHAARVAVEPLLMCASHWLLSHQASVASNIAAALSQSNKRYRYKMTAGSTCYSSGAVRLSAFAILFVPQQHNSDQKPRRQATDRIAADLTTSHTWSTTLACREQTDGLAEAGRGRV